MGRPAKSASIHRLHGNPSKLSEEELERRDREEVKPHPVAPRPPADLSPDARRCWDALSPELDRLGLLTVIDAQSFELCCESYALAKECLRQMRPKKADGSTDRRRRGRDVVVADHKYGGVKRHPAFSVYIQAEKEFREWCRVFGLGPAFRVGLRSGAPIGSVPDDGSDDEAFFGT